MPIGDEDAQALVAVQLTDPRAGPRVDREPRGDGGATMIYQARDGLGPHQVRAATFDARWRGLDPEQVYAFLSCQRPDGHPGAGRPPDR